MESYSVFPPGIVAFHLGQCLQGPSILRCVSFSKWGSRLRRNFRSGWWYRGAAEVRRQPRSIQQMSVFRVLFLGWGRLQRPHSLEQWQPWQAGTGGNDSVNAWGFERQKYSLLTFPREHFRACYLLAAEDRQFLSSFGEIHRGRTVSLFLFIWRRSAFPKGCPLRLLS